MSRLPLEMKRVWYVIYEQKLVIDITKSKIADLVEYTSL
jgi:hypothetical protein